jgi:hypothetical protein
MTTTALYQLLLHKLYALAAAGGHGQYYSLNEIAAQAGVLDVIQILDVAKTLKEHGLIRARFELGGNVRAYISAEGALMIESGRSEQPRPYIVDESIHFHGAVSGSNIAARSHVGAQTHEPPAEVLQILNGIVEALQDDQSLLAQERLHYLDAVLTLRKELISATPKLSVVETMTSTLKRVSSVADLVKQLEAWWPMIPALIHLLST